MMCFCRIAGSAMSGCALWALLFVGCSEPEAAQGDTETGNTDADADTDADGDADNDADGDSDADADADGDADTDGDGDTDTDGDGDADSDGDGDMDGDTDGDADTDTDTDADGDTDTDTDTDTDADSDTDADTDSDADSDIDPAATYRFKSVRTGAGGGFIVDVIFHPAERDLIYAKTDMGGAYRWNPADESWTQLFNFVSAENWNWTGIESIALDPSNPDLLYVAAGTYTNDWADTNGIIWKSSDRGRNFTAAAHLPFKMGGNMPGRGMGERLAVDPNDGNVLYFGAREEKGLWKSTDAGLTWTEVANFPDKGPYKEDPDDTWDYNNHAVGIPWVIFDPASGTPGSPSKTIYVGVAQNKPNTPNLYRSTDAGTTWEAIPGQPVSTLNGTQVTVTGGTAWDMAALGDDGSLAYDTTGLLPKNGKLDSEGTLYVTYSNWAGPYQGNMGDVWKFVPGTETWTRINPANDTNDYLSYGSQWFGYGGLGVDLQHPGTLVVAAVNSWWPDGMLFRTTDGGTTWKPIWEFNGYPSVNRYYTIDISQAPWLNMGVTSKSDPEPPFMLGWMMEGLSIDPFNADRMMYGTGATLYAVENLTDWDAEGGVIDLRSAAWGMEETSVLDLVSPNDGEAHLASAVGDVGGWVHTDLDTPPAVGYSIPDSGTNTSIDFAENTPATMVRVGEGFAVTYNGGSEWNKSWATLPGTYGEVAISPDGAAIVWAPKDGPVSYAYNNGGSSWTASTGVPDGANIASDRVNLHTFYALKDNTFYVSTDNGASFVSAATENMPAAGELHAVPGFEGHVWIAGGEQTTGGSSTADKGGLLYTTDGGKTFTRIEAVTTAEAIGFGAPPPDADYPSIFLAGTVDDLQAIYRSDDRAATWQKITDPTHQYATIQCITGDPRIYGRVYFGTNGLGIVYGDIIE